MHNPIENIRQAYKPDYIKILFVGESAPSTGDFLYFGNNPFTTYTRKAFEKAYKLRFLSDKAFLDYFKNQGCFFDDLSHEPVDHLGKGHRDQALKGSAFSLAMRLQMYQPDVVITCLKKIESHVEEAIRIADIQCLFYTLPFPEKGHQDEYIDGLVRILTN